MSDCILRIFEGTDSFPGSLTTEIGAECIDYRIALDTGFNPNMARFVIANPSKKYDVVPDNWDGTNENVRVWAAHTRLGGGLMCGAYGIVTEVTPQGSNLLIDGEGIGKILRRKAALEEFFHSKDDAGNDWTPDKILTATSGSDGIDGLITKYLSTDYGSIGMSTYVDSASGGSVSVQKIDGRWLWDISKELADSAYGTNNESFDSYLFGTYAAPATYGIELYFRERFQHPVVASRLRITQSMCIPKSLIVKQSNVGHVQAVIVRGKKVLFTTGEDTWTDSTSDWAVNDEGSDASVLESDFSLYGSSSLRFQRAGLDPTGERATFFYDDGNTMADDRYTKLRFYAMAVSAESSPPSSYDQRFYVMLGVKDRYGNQDDINDDSKVNHLYYQCKINASADGIDPAAWVPYEIELPKSNESGDWNNGTDNFANSGIDFREWYTIEQFGIHLDDDAGEEIVEFILDGLQFVGEQQFSGSAYDGGLTSSSDRLRELPIVDRGLPSNTDCSNLAGRALSALNRHSYEGGAILHGSRRDFTLLPGAMVEVDVPLNNQKYVAGQSVVGLPVKKIVLTPNLQGLVFGYGVTQSEIINNEKIKYRRLAQIQ